VSILKKIVLRYLTALTVACSLVLFPVHAQVASEYQIKAIFLFNFTQFVEWPTTAFADTNAIVIGILGEDPFGPYLMETVQGEEVNGHPLVVQHYQKVEDVKACHILFINASEMHQIKKIFISLKSRNILTVSDALNFTKQGGMIRFFTENNKIRIRINLNAAKDANLTISSKLLRLADIVRPINN
jgi:hypothetical protein